MKTYLFLSCVLLGAGISMSSLADTLVVDALWEPSKMEIVLSTSAAFLYIVFGEYLIHRFVLHGRFFGDNKWRREHLQHHIIGDNDHWFGPSVIGGLLATSPLLAVIFYITGIYGFFWSCCVVLTYLYFSKAVHRAVHQPHFLRYMPWHNLISKHHEAHHLRPNCNFSLLFPFVDRVFQKREKTLSQDMKLYLFLSGLLLGTSISMSSLMADTRVLDDSCNDARYGACTSAQTLLTANEIMLDVENKEDFSLVEDYREKLVQLRRSDYPLYKEIFDITDQRFLSTDDERSLFAETLVIAAKIAVVTVVFGAALMFGVP